MLLKNTYFLFYDGFYILNSLLCKKEPWKLLISVIFVFNHFFLVLCYFYIYVLYFEVVKSGVHQVSFVKFLHSFKIKLLSSVMLCCVICLIFMLSLR